MRASTVKQLVLYLTLFFQSFSSEAGVPPAPENLRPGWINGTIALLNWQEVPGAASYNVYRYDVGTMAWTTEATGLTNVYFYETVPAPIFPTSYAVTAVNVDGEGDAALTSMEEAHGDFVITLYEPSWWNPGSLTDTNAILSWSVSALSGADWMLELSTHPDGPYSAVGMETNYVAWQTAVLSNLAPATVYYSRLTTVGTNRGGWTHLYSFATLMTNQPPTASDVMAMTWFGDSTYINLSGFDPDPMDTLSFFITSQPTNGTLSPIQPGGWGGQVTVIYTPNPNVRGIDYFSFVVNDGRLTSPPAWVSIDNYLPNRTPVPEMQSITSGEEMPVTITLSAIDADGDTVEFYLLDPLPDGVWDRTGNLGTNGQVNFTPPINLTGQLSFIFYARDTNSSYAAGTIFLNITNVNDAPVATNVDQTVGGGNTPLQFFGWDMDNDALTYEIIGAPSHGAVTLQGNTWAYQPEPGFSGSDALVYRAFDGQLHSGSATLFLNVVTNVAPVATNQNRGTFEDQDLQILLSGSDADGDPLTYSIVTPPAHGTVSTTPPTPGLVTYVPAPNYNGNDGFTFKANDGSLDSAHATVSITVTPANDAPSLPSQSGTLDEDSSIAVTLSANDADGDSLTYRVLANPLHGSLSGTAPHLIYTPATNYNGTDTITFVASDGTGEGNAGTATLNVTPVNDMPFVTNQSITTAEDTAVVIMPEVGDVDGDPISFTVFTAPAHGTVSISAGTFLYTPAANYFGPDSFEYQAHDPNGGDNTATVSLTVTPSNDAPVANAQSVSAAYNTPVNFTFSGSDPDGGALNFITLSNPANGVLSGTGATRTFTPNLNWSGTNSFAFKVNDGTLESPTATVTITVAPPASVPPAPTNLVAIAVSKTQINIAWVDNSTLENGFKIERSTSATSGWAQIATVGPNVTNFSSTGLSANKLYYYRIRAYNNPGNSPYSNTASAKTLK